MEAMTSSSEQHWHRAYTARWFRNRNVKENRNQQPCWRDRRHQSRNPVLIHAQLLRKYLVLGEYLNLSLRSCSEVSWYKVSLDIAKFILEIDY